LRQLGSLDQGAYVLDHGRVVHAEGQALENGDGGVVVRLAEIEADVVAGADWMGQDFGCRISDVGLSRRQVAGWKRVVRCHSELPFGLILRESRSGGIGFLESVKLTKGADDTVASLGEILKGLHDGEAELPPVGGVGIVGGDRGRIAVAGIGLNAPWTGCAKRRII
jgi:hypothetical protein